MSYDIRDKAALTPMEILDLNFIRKPGACVFRKHFRAGLRSHITELLSREDVIRETRGEVIHGVRRFHGAKPEWILRIFRKRFSSLDQVLEDIDKYKLVLKFLGPDRIARSNEFVVDYLLDGTPHIVLCGLQEYIDGEILDPWGLYGTGYLADLFDRMPYPDNCRGDRVSTAVQSIDTFVERTRKMISESGFIPDLAGIGNLLLTPEGTLKLVDINNIVPISRDDSIPIDDKGYPSCDKSVETLAILETKILSRPIPGDDPLYGIFLQPDRKKQVLELERAFYESLRTQSE
ncbi:MAG: hypothetical protein V1793_08315 [Pseudomonadota bacterium]